MKQDAIAIIGMSGRFPGAATVEQFWENLRDGVESIRDCSDSELTAAGATREELADSRYVKRAAILDGFDLFDASLFGFSPRDASIMDPQHRQFLECAWEAFEDAGHPPKSFDGSIGVFAGSGMNTYLLNNLLANRKLVESAGLFQLKQTGNDKDVLATRVSYEFDLRGPSINVQTACSTSLVAVHLACQSLLNYECDMTLAGGVTIEVPHGLGYVYRDGEILSRDGHCRSFDAESTGTVFSGGAGIVVLRRLEDALKSRDHIRAVILGSAINNDGARKVGFLAPSVEGQAEVIAEAIEFTGVSARDITYVEAHGTGTVVGDPIEVRALTQAFRRFSQDAGYCRLGSVKSNIGHADAASGVAGLIKTVLALEHGQLPPTLHFQRPNPHIEFHSSPFLVNEKLRDWPRTGAPRRAGVTSLGIGGTNAHVVLEEAPENLPARTPKPHQLLTVSAHTEASADRALLRLADHLQGHPELALADIAFTCQSGRSDFAHRRAIVVEDSREAISAFSLGKGKGRISGTASQTAPGIVFMFSGQGAQHVNMGHGLYESEPVVRETLDLCASILKSRANIDLLREIYPDERTNNESPERLNQTWLTQPALFALEYSLARWWISLGVQPSAMVGHSVGEYVAACLAGVFSLEDALSVIALRGRLIYDLPPGAMLAVPLAPDQLNINDSLSIAAVNGPAMCVVSGDYSAIEAYRKGLEQKSVACRRLRTSHAFHSSMMDPILAEFEQRLAAVRLHPPSIPYVSNVSGTWITSEEATSPAYWARHIRHTVRFAECLRTLTADRNRVVVECGPGSTLTALALQQNSESVKALSTLPHPQDKIPDTRHALQTLGELWVAGVNVDWNGLHVPGSVQRVSLPTYSFDHKRFWIDADRTEGRRPTEPTTSAIGEHPVARTYKRAWRKAALDKIGSGDSSQGCVVFRDSLGIGERVIARLSALGHRVVSVEPGTRFNAGNGKYKIRPSVREDYDALLSDFARTGFSPRKILHLWSLCGAADERSLEETLSLSFFSPLFLAQALGSADISGTDLVLTSNCLHQVEDEPTIEPARAVLLGPARVISKELPGIRCRAVDFGFPNGTPEDCAEALIAELRSSGSGITTAYRKGERYLEGIEEFDLAGAPAANRLEKDGVYLITGGLGGIGLEVARQLARQFKAHLILVGRSAIPPESEWASLVNQGNLLGREKDRIAKLIEIRASATDLVIEQADVTNETQMRDVVRRSLERFGRIDGAFHAAGVLEDGPLMLKDAEAAMRVLRPKVHGTVVLEKALAQVQLKCFVLFSSISTISAPAGQVDYVAANAFLDAFAYSRRGPVTAVDWDAWRGTGMADRTTSIHPLLDKRLVDTPEEITYSTGFSTEEHWVLREHRLKQGSAVFPGTGYLEMAAGALPSYISPGPIEFTGVNFLAPLSLQESELAELRIQLRREGVDQGKPLLFHFSVSTRNVEHCNGLLSRCSEPSASRASLSAIRERCGRSVLNFDEQHRTRQENHFLFGPRWRCLKRLYIGENEGLAELEMDEASSPDFSAFRMYPALLDMATGCSLYSREDYESSGNLYLPMSYRRLRSYRPLTKKLYSHFRLRNGEEASKEVLSFDITLLGEDGQMLADIDGFAMRRIGEVAKVTYQETRQAGSSSIDFERPNSSAGIAPEDGVKILDQLLRHQTPPSLIVASKSLDQRSETSAVSEQEHVESRVTAESIEDTLTGWFEELLGASGVSVDDDFFALGGHSLTGVRLFAKIRNTYKVDLELSALFGMRTVRGLAEAIREKRAPVRIPVSTSSCLVPIQPNGSKPPLIFIHAVGGEVLFYEPLARIMGPDQPIWAMRSPLVFHHEQMDTSIEDLAAIYVKEILDLLPSGPYLLGGHSFGGFVAFEMAQQLLAKGRETALVAVIDAVVPGSHQHIDRSGQLTELVRKVRGGGMTYLMQKAALKREYLSQKIVHRTRILMSSAYHLAKKQLPPELRYAEIEEAHFRALERYSVRTYSGRITLLRAVDRGANGVLSISERDDPKLGWGAIANGGLDILDVQADHSNILIEPQVGGVAQAINAALAALETRSAVPARIA